MGDLKQTEVGIIGLGQMGKLYARTFAANGFRVNASDLPSKFHELSKEFEGTNIRILSDGWRVCRRSDFIIYSVETANIRDVVQKYACATKVGAIVGGQCSVKTPEIEAFEEFLMPDVNIVTLHSLHGPDIPTQGQTLVFVPHRVHSPAVATKAKDIIATLGSTIVEMDYIQHDKITADTQAVTHVALMSMGRVWSSRGNYPWENPTYIGGLENVKILLTVRIFSSFAHIYAGLAIMNPHAVQQVQQYAQSVGQIFRMMITESEAELRQRVKEIKEFIFQSREETERILLPDDELDRFSLSSRPHNGVRKPNSHLSLFAMADCWHQLRINPYKHMICSTPPFRIRLGIVEYLFHDTDLLEESIRAAVFDKSLRHDDMEFYLAANVWASIISSGDVKGYTKMYEEIQEFFRPRIPEARTSFAEMNRLLSRLN